MPSPQWWTGGIGYTWSTQSSARLAQKWAHVWLRGWGLSPHECQVLCVCKQEHTWAAVLDTVNMTRKSPSGVIVALTPLQSLLFPILTNRLGASIPDHASLSVPIHLVAWPLIQKIYSDCLRCVRCSHGC